MDSSTARTARIFRVFAGTFLGVQRRRSENGNKGLQIHV